jgi:hypothetical protein
MNIQKFKIASIKLNKRVMLLILLLNNAEKKERKKERKKDVNLLIDSYMGYSQSSLI